VIREDAIGKHLEGVNRLHPVYCFQQKVDILFLVEDRAPIFGGCGYEV